MNFLRKGDIVKIHPRFLEEFPHLDQVSGRVRTIDNDISFVYFKLDHVGIHFYEINHRKLLLSVKKLR